MGTGIRLDLSVHSERLAVCRLDPQADVPPWATQGGYFSLTRTTDELSIVCGEQLVPPGTTCEPGWLAFRVEGQLDFGAVGVLAAIVSPLAKAGISVLAIATYATDYVLVREFQSELALAALQAYGHCIRR